MIMQHIRIFPYALAGFILRVTDFLSKSSESEKRQDDKEACG